LDDQALAVRQEPAFDRHAPAALEAYRDPFEPVADRCERGAAIRDGQ